MKRRERIKILYNAFFEKNMPPFLKSKDGILAARSPGKPLYVYAPSSYCEKSAFEFLRSASEGLMGIIAPPKITEIFKNQKNQREIKQEQVLLAAALLNDLSENFNISGVVRPFDEDKSALVSEWIKNFYAEALNFKASGLNAASLLKTKKLFGLFINGNPRAMGMYLPLKKEMARINLIYAPPEYRRQGYARNLTLELCRIVQNQGLIPVLYVRKNSTAAKMYESLGFKTAGELRELRFIEFNN